MFIEEYLRNAERIRKDLGITQTELSQKARVSQSTICEIESGLRNAKYKTLARIVEAIEQQKNTFKL